jgi:ABC-type glycerol-3-phosphate transport system substrate-binding protein
MTRWLVRLTLFLVAVGVLIGCQDSDSATAPLSTPSGTLPPTLEDVSRTATAPDLSPLAPSTSSLTYATGPISLTVWITEEFEPSDNNPGGRQLRDQLQAFDQSRADLELDVVVKRATGPGSIVDYLYTAVPVAPKVLPDLATLSNQNLEEIAPLPAPAGAESLLQPLDELIPPNVIGDLFPVGRALGTVGGQLLGIPFMLDLEHLVYNTAVLSDSVPHTWNRILASGGPYVFPAAEEARVDTPLLHYLAAGGRLTDDGGNPRLAIDPLTEVFRFYQRCAADRVIPVATVQTRSLAESFGRYENNNALIAHVNASTYLSERAGLFSTGVAPIPGPNRPGASFVTGWHWAVVTSDPVRRQMAVDLITWLAEADNLGIWSYAGSWLPATQSALLVWPEEDDYLPFAREQLLSGIRWPGDAYYQAVQARLAGAVRDVLLGNANPAEAASSATP